MFSISDQIDMEMQLNMGDEKKKKDCSSEYHEYFISCKIKYCKVWD